MKSIFARLFDTDEFEGNLIWLFVKYLGFACYTLSTTFWLAIEIIKYRNSIDVFALALSIFVFVTSALQLVGVLVEMNRVANDRHH